MQGRDDGFGRRGRSANIRGAERLLASHYRGMDAVIECDDQSEVIDFLSRGDTYGVSEGVERIDTHAASVFLAEARAYKLKRAVRYPYLDFSTVEKRRQVCEVELQLNRRTAPDLYLEIRAVRRKPDGALSFEEGEPVDWLVVMRRFPAQDLLAAVAERGELNAPLMRELADRIAAFHAEAEIRQGGGAEAMRRVIDGNRTSMEQVADVLPGEQADALHRRSIALLRELTPLLDRRAREGRVRHCHGDLHLGNICLWHGKPTLFDCLEFDPRLATIDVLYDLAFLLMDLWARGHHYEAALLFNRYLDRTDEEDGIAAVPLFLSMRAAVRAHVEASAAHSRRGADRAAKVAAALAFLEPQEARLVAVGGLSGTGKSTLAAALAARTGGTPGARWLRSDVLRKRLHGVAPETRLPAAAYAAEASGAVYAELLATARRMLKDGRSVVVDAVFARESERQALAAVAREVGVDFTGLWLAAPADLLRERLAQRQNDVSDADGAVLERQLGYDLGDLAGWHSVSAAGSVAEVLGPALRIMETSP